MGKHYTLKAGTTKKAQVNYEEQYYTSRNKNIRIEEGLLVIEARKEDFKDSEYTSARINTSGKTFFTVSV